MNVEGLSLDQMRAALTVAENGSFSAAARRLNRKQSTLSYAVATLETQLGVALFERADGHQPRPTEIGRALLLEMEALVRRADEIKKQAQAAANGLESELTIAIDAMYPPTEIAAVLDGFAKQFPTVQLRLNVESMGEVHQSVTEGKATLGISGGYLALPPSLIGDAISQVTRLPVAAPDHPLAANLSDGQRLPHRLLLDQIQIVLSDPSNASRGRDYTVYTGRTWRVSDLTLKRNLLIAGLGWGYLPEHMIADDLATGMLRALHVEGLRDKNVVAFLVVRRREGVVGPSAQWVLSRLMVPAGRNPRRDGERPAARRARRR